MDDLVIDPDVLDDLFLHPRLDEVHVYLVSCCKNYALHVDLLIENLGPLLVYD